MITETAGYHQGYDAAQDNTTRSLLLFPTNSRTELSSYTRARLQEKARALEGNFTPITRIRAKFGRAVAGRGIFPVPVTADAEWNKAAKLFIERWASNPFLYSVDGSRDMWEDQRLDAEGRRGLVPAHPAHCEASSGPCNVLAVRTDASGSSGCVRSALTCMRPRRSRRRSASRSTTMNRPRTR